MLKIDDLGAVADIVERVAEYREILTQVYRQGFKDGYHAAMSDRSTALLLAKRTSREPA